MITWKDEWLAEDKIFHATGSFTAAAVLIWAAHWLLDEITLRHGNSGDFIDRHCKWWFRIVNISCALVFLGGIALEWYQYSHGIDVFSVKDLIWNTLGIAAAWGVMR